MHRLTFLYRSFFGSSSFSQKGSFCRHQLNGLNFTWMNHCDRNLNKEFMGNLEWWVFCILRGEKNETNQLTILFWTSYLNIEQCMHTNLVSAIILRIWTQKRKTTIMVLKFKLDSNFGHFGWCFNSYAQTKCSLIFRESKVNCSIDVEI